MFVADFANGLVVFNLPLTATSAPAFTIAGGGTAGVAFDAAGNLYVSNVFARTIAVYASPISATSTPSKTIGPITGASLPGFLVFDSAGNLYVADFGNSQVEIFHPPFVGGPQAPAITMTGVPGTPVGMAFDLQGDLFVSGYTGVVVTAYRRPFVGGANTAVATMALPTGGGGIGRDTANDLIVGQADGTLALIGPPFATGVTPFTVIGQTFLGGNPLDPAVEALNSATDASGNIWVPFAGDGVLAPPPPAGGANQIGIAEFNPPFNGSNVSLIGLFQTGLGLPFSIAFGK